MFSLSQQVGGYSGKGIDTFSCAEVSHVFLGLANSRVPPFVKKLGMAWASAIIKSWVNAWTTSSRMHEDEILPCIFGSDYGEEDSLGHDLCCEPLWTIIISFSHVDKQFLKASSATKLGFGPLPSAWLQCLCVAFSCYHAIKLGHRCEVQYMIESGKPCQVICRLLNHAVLFSRDM